MMSRVRSGFENDVKIYGIQTFSDLTTAMRQFENDVKIYGIQTLELGIAMTT